MELHMSTRSPSSDPDNSPIPTTVLTGPAAQLRLGQLGVSADELLATLSTGYGYAAGCTDHDPRSLPGMLVWGKGIGHLRDLKRPDGWRAARHSNYETTVHPQGTHQIALASGTSQTGDPNGPPPRTRTPKGPATSRAVKRNRQLSLDQGTNVFAGPGVESFAEQDRATYLLMHYYHIGAGEIRAELSRPEAMEGKHISEWRERIIVPVLPFAEDVRLLDEDPIDEIDVDVRRKAD
jgi:hypothetical protein